MTIGRVALVVRVTCEGQRLGQNLRSEGRDQPQDGRLAPIVLGF
jgi:hypothetical protein